MDVIFERVDARRYRIGALRNGRHDVGGDVAVRPAPGHADVPHDLVHFVIEEQAGLRLGIFGQVAAGGDVGGFFREPARSVTAAKRSRRLGRAGRHEVGESERLAALVDHRGKLRPDADLDPPLHRRIDARLADVLARWQATAPGRRLVLPWPDSLTIRHGVVPR